MMTYLLLHGFASLLIFASLKLLVSAPPRLRLWFAFGGMALWLVPMPLFRPTLHLKNMPEPLITTIQVLELAPSSAESSIPTSEISAPAQLGISWSTLLILLILFIGLWKWASSRRQHRQWLRQLNRHARPMLENTAAINWGITAPIFIMPGYGAMTTGVFRPKIWVGAEHLEQPELSSLLLHEWQHIQQADNLWTASIHFLECLCWWNPLALYFGRQARFYIELSCDQKCIRLIDYQVYQRALARTLQHKLIHPFSSAALVTAAQGSGNTNISRLKLLNRSFKMNFRQTFCLLAISAVGSIALAFPNISPQTLLPTVNNFQITGETPTEDSIARVGQTGVTPPVFTKKTRPKYPERAMKIGLQGYVILEAVLRKDGSVTDMKILRGLGKGRFGFEEASMEALEQWQFKPGRVNGRAADVRMTLKIDFVLQDNENSLPILKWDSLDMPEDVGGTIKRPVAKLTSKTKKKDQPKPNLVIPVEVEIDAAGHLVDFEPDGMVLGQLLYPDLALEQLKSLLADIEWTPARTEDQGFATVMTLNLKIHLGTTPEN